MRYCETNTRLNGWFVIVMAKWVSKIITDCLFISNVKMIVFCLFLKELWAAHDFFFVRFLEQEFVCVLTIGL